MLLNFLVNFYLLIPVWLIKLICIFNKDIKREYIFDPQSKLLIYLFPKLELQNVKNDEIQNLRSAIEKRRTNLRISKKPKKEIKKVDHYLDKDESILLREYSPYKVDNKNIILFFHGGGYVLNSVFTHDDMVAYFSEKLRTRIFSLDYKLAPENKFPAALENAIQAVEWLEDKSISSENISLCGDSAGGHLAASLTHHFTNEGKKIHSQFLMYPMCDPNCDSESHKIFGDKYFLTNQAMKWFWKHLQKDEIDMKDEMFNLLLINKKITADHTFIITAGFDPLHDEAEKYAALLHNMNNNVKQLHYPSMFHGFATMTRLKTANRAVNDFLREYKKIL
ncbi:MAG: alpha/beta hydrolase [Pseudomonadota bacterium]|nr:alpha/beta hydrolase [Pseudomonadota bacterium]